MSTLHQAVI